MNKKKYNYKGNRTIQDDIMTIKPGQQKLNPLTLKIDINNDKTKDIYITKFHIINDTIKNISYDKSKKLDNTSRYMLLPPILIPSSEFLLIHNITI